MKNQIKLFLSTAFFLLISLYSFSQDGSLDTTLDTDGIVTTRVLTVTESGNAIAIQPDGKIIVAGSSYASPSINCDFAIVRYNPNGSLDTTFDVDGKLTTDIGTQTDVPVSIALQSDGKIVVGGYSDIGPNVRFALARYNYDGSLDTTFDLDGKLNTIVGNNGIDGAYSIAIQPDGKIIAAGISKNSSINNFALVRYNSNGILDSTFGLNGKKITSFGTGNASSGNSVVIQSDGKIIVAGGSNNGTNSDFALVRYNPNGSLDATFDTDGKLTTDIGNSDNSAKSVAIQQDGKIVAVGTSYGIENKFALVRYNVDGSLDTTFDSDGKVTTIGGVANSVVIQADGKIVVAGVFNSILNDDFAILRYNSDGSLDTTFGVNGKSIITIQDRNDEARGVAIQSDGKIVLAGGTTKSQIGFFALLRLNNTVLGLDNDYLQNQFEVYPNPVTNSLKIKSQNNDIIKKIKIINLLGQVILEKDISDNFNNQELNIDTSNFLTGIHQLIIYGDKGNWKSKFIKN